jgi:hypothetical protein
MITVNQKNMDLYFKKGYKTDNLNVRSFKMYGDGALGLWCLHAQTLFRQP